MPDLPKGLVLSTHPQHLQASAIYFFSALAYPGATTDDGDNRVRFSKAMASYFVQGIAKQRRAAGASRRAASAGLPHELVRFRPDHIQAAFNRAGRRIDRRLGATYIFRCITTPPLPWKFTLPLSPAPMPLAPVGHALRDKFAELDDLFDAQAGSRATAGEEVDQGRQSNLRRVIWAESMPVLHLALALDDLLDERREALAAFDNKIVGLVNDPSWLPDAVAHAQHRAAVFLPTVLPLSDVERLLPVSLTPDPY